MSVLTEEHTLERAQLEIKKASGALSGDDAWRLKTLSFGDTRPAPSHTMSLGSRAATSLAFKNLASKGASRNVPLTEDVRLTSLRGDEFKALVTGASDTSAGAFVTNMRGTAVAQPRRRLSVLDLATVAETTVDAITYARQSAFTSTAAAVPEATSTVTGTKPEATIAFSVETATVDSYSTWVPVTRRSLSDVAGLRTTIDNQLTYSVRRKLEEVLVAAMVSGAGSTQAKGADTLLVATLKLLTTLRNADVEPSAVLLNPVDYEVVRAVTTAYNSPPITVDSDGTERLFGLPLIITPSVADDTAVVADMSSVACWLRSLDIFVTDSHSDWFVRNLSALLVELRAAGAVNRTRRHWHGNGLGLSHVQSPVDPQRSVTAHHPRREDLLGTSGRLRCDSTGRAWKERRRRAMWPRAAIGHCPHGARASPREARATDRTQDEVKRSRLLLRGRGSLVMGTGASKSPAQIGHDDPALRSSLSCAVASVA